QDVLNRLATFALASGASSSSLQGAPADRHSRLGFRRSLLADEPWWPRSAAPAAGPNVAQAFRTALSGGLPEPTRHRAGPGEQEHSAPCGSNARAMPQAFSERGHGPRTVCFRRERRSDPRAATGTGVMETVIEAQSG